MFNSDIQYAIFVLTVLGHFAVYSAIWLLVAASTLDRILYSAPINKRLLDVAAVWAITATHIFYPHLIFSRDNNTAFTNELERHKSWLSVNAREFSVINSFKPSGVKQLHFSVQGHTV